MQTKYTYQVHVNIPERKETFIMWSDYKPGDLEGIFKDVYSYYDKVHPQTGEVLQLGEDIVQILKVDELGEELMESPYTPLVEANFDETRPIINSEPESMNTSEAEEHNGVLPESGSEGEDYTISVQEG